MKVNPLGVQAYQTLSRQDKPATDRLDSPIKGAGDEKVVIEPQSPVTKSALAVKVPEGNYSKFLSVEERQALDMLFARFSDSGRFGTNYAADSEAANPATSVGRMVDVKV